MILVEVYRCDHTSISKQHMRVGPLTRQLDCGDFNKDLIDITCTISRFTSRQVRECSETSQTVSRVEETLPVPTSKVISPPTTNTTTYSGLRNEKWCCKGCENWSRRADWWGRHQPPHPTRGCKLQSQASPLALPAMPEHSRWMEAPSRTRLGTPPPLCRQQGG